MNLQSWEQWIHEAVRIDPFDISISKRIAHRKGIPFTRLMSMWPHEKIEQVKSEAGAQERYRNPSIL